MNPSPISCLLLPENRQAIRSFQSPFPKRSKNSSPSPLLPLYRRFKCQIQTNRRFSENRRIRRRIQLLTKKLTFTLLPRESLVCRIQQVNLKRTGMPGMRTEWMRIIRQIRSILSGNYFDTPRDSRSYKLLPNYHKRMVYGNIIGRSV